MKKAHLFAVLLVLFIVFPLRGETPEEFWKGKVIVINQLKQTGKAYENGVKLFEFDVLTGDDKKITEPGEYVVVKKRRHYHSLTYDTKMPYSLFFIWNTEDRKAIHEGEVPLREHKNPKKRRRALATNGCVHIEKPYIVQLFNWAEEEKTKVIIFGERAEE